MAFEGFPGLARNNKDPWIVLFPACETKYPRTFHFDIQPATLMREIQRNGEMDVNITVPAHFENFTFRWSATPHDLNSWSVELVGKWARG
jgi:hypothetical protein